MSQRQAKKRVDAFLNSVGADGMYPYTDAAIISAMGVEIRPWETERENDGKWGRVAGADCRVDRGT